MNPTPPLRIDDDLAVLEPVVEGGLDRRPPVQLEDLVRVLVGGEWVSNTWNDGLQHEPRILRDLDSADADVVSGPDVMHGDDGLGGPDTDDLMYGQGDDDVMRGGLGDDFMEGNAADDLMNGNPGQDDMIGGTVEASLTDGDDEMHGDEDADVMAGDNAVIGRPLDGLGQWTIDPNTADVIRSVRLLDVQVVGLGVDPAFSGDDEMHGGEEQDRLFGQGGDDLIHGDADFDYAEGNHGADTIYGDGGEDDLVGGGSANDGVISPTSRWWWPASGRPGPSTPTRATCCAASRSSTWSPSRGRSSTTRPRAATSSWARAAAT